METYLNKIFLFNCFVKANLIFRDFFIKLNKKISDAGFSEYLNILKPIFIDFADTSLGFKMLIGLSKDKIENNICYLGEHNYCFLKILDKIIKPDDTILDIGAKNGFYSLYISKIQKQKGKIYSFEDNTKSFDTLLKNIFINSAPNIVAKKIQNNTFLINKSGTETRNLDEWIKINEAENIKIILINSQKPFEIIKGCENTVYNNLPALYIDFGIINNDIQKYNVFNYLMKKNSYNIFQIKKHACNKISKINHAGDLLFCENMLCFNEKHLNMIEEELI